MEQFFHFFFDPVLHKMLQTVIPSILRTPRFSQLVAQQAIRFRKHYTSFENRVFLKEVCCDKNTGLLID